MVVDRRGVRRFSFGADGCVGNSFVFDVVGIVILSISVDSWPFFELSCNKSQRIVIPTTMLPTIHADVDFMALIPHFPS